MGESADKVTVYLFFSDKVFHGSKVVALEACQSFRFSTAMSAQHLVCSIVWVGLQMATCNMSVLLL